MAYASSKLTHTCTFHLLRAAVRNSNQQLHHSAVYFTCGSTAGDMTDVTVHDCSLCEVVLIQTEPENHLPPEEPQLRDHTCHSSDIFLQQEL